MMLIFLLILYLVIYLLYQFTIDNQYLMNGFRDVVEVRKRVRGDDDDDDDNDDDNYDDVVYDIIDSSDELEVQKRLVFPYRYTIDEPNFCDTDIKVLNVVPVRPSNRQVRDEIRATLGSKDVVSLTQLKVLFLVGASETSEEQQNLEEESLKYHDLVQVDFVDAYLNLTLKTLTALHWKQSRCAQVPWLLKSDDDVFTNPWAVTETLMEAKKDLVCRVLTQKHVCRAVSRHCRHKSWVISRETYAHDKYPPYCNGPAYALNQRAVSEIINRAASRKTHFPMEDAYFTGVLTQGLHLRYNNIGSRMQLYNLQSPPYKSLASGKALFVVDFFKKGNGRYTRLDLWQHLIDSRTKQ